MLQLLPLYQVIIFSIDWGMLFEELDSSHSGKSKS